MDRGRWALSMGRGPCHFNREVREEHSEDVTAEHGLQNGGIGIYHQEKHSSRRELPGPTPEAEAWLVGSRSRSRCGQSSVGRTGIGGVFKEKLGARSGKALKH